ncbi:hypothetical protein GYA28_00235 [Candidatus Roizmanbacteria bacterium]|jgi:hypothetical protein|nr:hypothetical protein [Candidatus Roizmanbacteria bacterium]
MLQPVNSILVQFWSKFSNFLPDFFVGLLIFVVGLIIAELLKKFIVTILNFFRLENLIQKSKLLSREEIKIWEEVLAEILRWTVIILFLVPTLEVWGLSKATAVINQFLFYIPNVIIAVIIGFIGIIAANLVAGLVKNSILTIGSTSANALSVFTKSTIIFFTVLVVMNQLGVAQDLIRILFTGIVAMLAIAGGLAFGLGGQSIAKDLLDDLKKKLK